MNIPYVNLAGQNRVVKKEILQAIGKVLESGQFILGKEVEAFERSFANLCGTEYALGVGTGTDALVLALRVLNIGPGDSVITVANSFISTASSIVLVGAKPVFVDVGEDYNINPRLIEKAINSRTKAILPVHLTGRPADMKSILEIAKKHKLTVIEDCAQAVGAEYREKCVGSFGTIGCFSLHPLKNLNACGDGGALTTNDRNLYRKLQILRNNGFSTRDNCAAWSDNSRLDTIQAALLLVKLNYLKKWTDRRRENAEFYQKHLSCLTQVKVPVERPYEKSVYHTFVIQAQDRDRLSNFLGRKGIGTKIHYPIPIHLQPAAKSLKQKSGSLLMTEKQAKMILSLPIYPELTTKQLSYIVNCIYDFYNQ
ncbi:MAG: DegT/DnrJ/EryC1/StrS family aminotransferase [Candidatus Omnitrophica bacterium]|jgi:dTDP-4-amino-4,6-dideoxygalactose transaminase|nr:DegT/DnrJ/EryC1/StrS family aminotransferase [Candidatus Omnitrophota bacterium]